MWIPAASMPWRGPRTDHPFHGGGEPRREMEDRPIKGRADRSERRRAHARPHRIIEKRPNWQDYLDPDEDPGLLEEEDLMDSLEEEGAESDTERGQVIEGVSKPRQQKKEARKKAERD